MNKSMLQRKSPLATAGAFVVSIVLLVILSGSYVSQNPTTFFSLSQPFRKHHKPAPWLLATMSPASGFRRRQVIRSTWQSLYHDPSHFDTRFVIANPTDVWRPVIEHENATFGDIIILEHLEEKNEIANSIKPIEFMKWLVKKSGRRWNWVSKVDDDSFLDAGTFYDEFLFPRLDANNTIIARDLPWAQMNPDSGINFTCPGGQFYTLSWDIMALLARLHDENPIDNEGEDGLLGKLLYEEKHDFDFVDLVDAKAFDVHEDMHAYGMQKQDLGLVGKMRQALNPHKMKSDEMYLKIAALFDEGGFKGREQKTLNESDR